MRVVAFTKYDSDAASTRQRILQYLPALAANGIHVDVRPLLPNAYVRSIVSGAPFPKATLARRYLRRMVELVSGPDCDLIWIYAELFPYLPAWFERLALRRKIPIIYDLDDAFFEPYDSHPHRLVRAIVAGKLEPLLRAAAACCCGNAYLRDYAARFCRRCIVLPTVVDTEVYRPTETQEKRDGPLTIGWIGSPSTWQYMRLLLPLLADLCRERRIRISVIGAGAGAEADRFPGLQLTEWREAAEVDDIQGMSIGIMPLPNEPWARGKSGYKLIQYMACGLPVVASPVGVNASIVKPGENGFLAGDEGEWRVALHTLLGDRHLRELMGAAGRRRAVAEYSLASQAPRLIEVLRTAGGGS